MRVHAFLNLAFADEIGGVAPVVTALRSAMDVAGPYPLRLVVRCAVAEQHPADRHAAPDHRVIVGAALAPDDGRTHAEGFGGGHPLLKRGPAGQAIARAGVVARAEVLRR